MVGCVCAPSSGGGADARFFTLSFPRVTLAKDESIQFVEVEAINGRVAAINRIPSDWTLELSDDCSSCTLTAGHFSSSFCNPRELDGLITVAAGHSTQFDLRARVMVETAGTNDSPGRELSFLLADLDLKAGSRPPRPAVACDVSNLPSAWFTEYRPPPRAANAAGEYMVQRGDTAGAMARDFRLSVQDLKAINPGVEFHRLRVGQMINVVKGRMN